MQDNATPQSVVSSPLLDRPIAFHRCFALLRDGAHVSSVGAALLLSQAVYWSNRQPPERGGWFWKKRDEWEEETTMSRREQETARKQLKALGVLEESLRGTPAKLWYRVNFSRLEELLILVQQVGRKAPNLDGGKRPTSEITSEISSGDEFPSEIHGGASAVDGLAPPISGGTQKAERPTTAQQERVRQIEVALSEIGLQGVPPRLIALWLRDCTVEGVKQAILECGAALVSMPNADSAGRYLTKVISSRVKKAAEQAATAEKAESNHWPFVAEEDEHFNKAAESWSDNDGRSLSRHPLKRLLAWDGRVEGAAKRMPYNAHLGLRAYFAPAAEWVPFWDMVEKHGPPPWLEWPEFQSHKREFEALKDPERRRQLDADIASWKAGKAARANAR